MSSEVLEGPKAVSTCDIVQPRGFDQRCTGPDRCLKCCRIHFVKERARAVAALHSMTAAVRPGQAGASPSK
eukprot:4296887-Pyramimonas_sp.AAC.1